MDIELFIPFRYRHISVVYFLTNVNLIVPVVAAVAVIVIAIAVICVLRGSNEPPPGFPKGTV